MRGPKQSSKAWTAATEKAKAEERPVTARDVQAEVDKAKQAAIAAEEERYAKKKKPVPKLAPPCIGMHYARMAIMRLSEITRDDTERAEALETVKEWINENE
jgi:hypothetical protein